MNLIKVIASYNEPHRHYHNLTHIRRIFGCATRNEIYLTDSQRVAIFFHDVIYNPQSKTNEEDSVVRMREMCRPENVADEKVLNDAEKIILLTKEHISEDVETGIVLDLDLNELGADWDRFLYNDRNIRKEYFFATDEQWNVGRGNFMLQLLLRPQIFNTSRFRDKYEKPARDNIKKLLGQLGRIVE